MSIRIEFDSATLRAVEALAEEQHRSADEVVRDAVTAYLQSSRRRLGPGMGQYRSGCNDVSQRADEFLQQAVSEGQWP